MKKFFLPAMLALLLFTTGCEQQPSESPPDKPATTKPQTKSESKPVPSKPESKPESTTPAQTSDSSTERTEKMMYVKVYFPDDSGMRLVEVEREILVNDATDKYTAAVDALLDEPVEENLTRIFPKNASIRSVKVDGDLAIVDFDGSLVKNFVGGSTGEEFLIGSIVDTLTNFPEVKRVKFLVNGQEIETLSGHMDLSIPLERMNALIE